MSSQQPDSKEMRGKRLKEVRALTGMNRRSLARKYSLSEHTLRNWEYASQNGLTEQGARQMADIYQKEQIDCTVNWLLYGIGTPPKRIEPTIIRTEATEAPDQIDATIQDEINSFKLLHSEAVVQTIRDDSMLPDYRMGDIVAGVRHYANNIYKAIGKDCIIETKKGETLIRTLVVSTILGRYNLYAINRYTRIEKPHHYDEEIISAAPIIWIRRGKKW